MKKILIFLPILLIIFICLYSFNVGKTVDTNDIVFISRTTNYAWGKTDKGYIVLKDGSSYHFDFSDIKEDNYSFLRKLEEGLNNGSVTPNFKSYKDLVEKLNELSVTGNTYIEYLWANMSMDRGSTEYYFVKDGDLILLFATGDWYQIPLDEELREQVIEISKLVHSDISVDLEEHFEMFKTRDK